MTTDAAPSLRLDQRVALVTGAARGIGAVIAYRFAALGAVVALADIQPPRDWPDAALQLRARGAPAVSLHRSDIRDPAACARLIDEVDREHGGLDILVNNAGVTSRRSAEDTDEAEWRRILDTNLGGVFRMSRAALRLLRSSPDAAVVNMGSTAGAVAINGAAAYGVSKAGVLHLTRILASEWAADRIRVNAVAPTIVPTGMTAEVRASPQYMAEKLATIPLGRMARPEEVAAAVAYLASPAAAMITGQTLFLDGGATIR